MTIKNTLKQASEVREPAKREKSLDSATTISPKDARAREAKRREAEQLAALKKQKQR